MATSDSNQLLGYPTDARLLIINADDFGMCHAVNAAILRALQQGVVTSTSLMVPCPWAPHALRLLREHPDIPFAVHLTLVCEYDDYRWGPVAAKDAVPSLLDEEGFFPRLGQPPDRRAKGELAEIDVEFRAQIERVLAADLRPSHLDWHCLPDGGRPDVFDLTFRLAREYGLALRTHERRSAEVCRSQDLPCLDHPVLDSYMLDSAEKSSTYARLLRELPAGLSEWAVHPGLGDTEARAISPDGWPVRLADYDWVMSQEAKDIIATEGIIQLDYHALQAVWTQRHVR